MVIYSPSDENPFVFYYRDSEKKGNREYLENSKKARKSINAGHGTILVFDGLKIDEELEILVKLWNENKEINSSELLFRISSMARYLKLEISLK